MIYRLRDLIPDPQCVTMRSGHWVRAVQEPFWGGLFDRLRDAIEVFRGPKHAVAVRWPQPGEYEDAMFRIRERTTT